MSKIQSSLIPEIAYVAYAQGIIKYYDVAIGILPSIAGYSGRLTLRQGNIIVDECYYEGNSLEKKYMMIEAMCEKWLRIHGIDIERLRTELKHSRVAQMVSTAYA